jgi:hypothetical protein
MLQPIVFRCVGIGISTGLPRLHVIHLVVCVLSCDLCKIRLVSDFLESCFCVSRVCVCTYVFIYLFIYIRYVILTVVCSYLGCCVLVSEVLYYTVSKHRRL